jgi:tRNA (cmo5U34)-methyltransferase
MDSLQHKPDGRWAFDEKVGDCFDDMVERSVPMYRESLELLARIASSHIDASGKATIIDLGCSNGQALSIILDTMNAAPKAGRLRCIGVDCEDHMLQRARKRLGASIELVQHDLREPLPYMLGATKPDVVFLLWTAQFIPIEHRARLFREVRECISPTGALFVAEKLRGQTSRFQTELAKQYRAWKIRAGYTAELVDAKARALEGVLVSLSAPEQKQFMQSEGWSVEEVSRYLGFATYYLLPR